MEAVTIQAKNIGIFFLSLLHLYVLYALYRLLQVTSLLQGPFSTFHLFGAGTHQEQRCATDILQPVSCKAVLRQSPPGPRHDSATGHGAFVVSPSTVWYARVLLLFSATATTDTGSKSFDCALISTLETFDDPENGN